MQVGVNRLQPWLLEGDGRPLDLPEGRDDRLSNRLALLDADTVLELKEHDLHAIAPKPTDVELIDLADKLIRPKFDLASIIDCCVHEIIVLHAPDDAYDVSHSEPRWATRIFVSIPKLSPIAPLRVAEALVHEAMHLNLTFLESRTELTSTTRALYSPWKAEARPASGVLHALYVFACIYRFLNYLSGRSDQKERAHITRRLTDIRDEVALIDRPLLFGCLTENGLRVAQAALEAVDISPTPPSPPARP